MDFIAFYLGRFHPMLVHFPIGILLLAFAFELLALWKQFSYLKPAVQPALFIGAIAAAASCITGYLLSQEGGYSERLLVPHQYFGIATAILSFSLFFLRKTAWINRPGRENIGFFCFLPVVLTLSLTGHLGGSLTHGEEFLSLEVVDSPDDATSFVPIENIDQAMVYEDVVRPILKSKCYSCHSAKKKKGGLRLDEIEYIKRGGEHGGLIVNGIPDSSLLYKVLLLPLEADKHMPPKAKPQLSSTEIAILKNWIEEGASFDKKVVDFAQPANMRRYIASLNEAPSQHWVPSEKVDEPDLQTVIKLRSKGILVLPVASESNYLTVNFINKKNISVDELRALVKLKQQLLWLNLASTSIGDDQLSNIAALENLRWLYLNNTEVSDIGMRKLTQLDNLMVLNVVGTRLTDSGFQELGKIRSLKNIFVYNTGITDSGIADFRKTYPAVAIDRGGYTLPKIPSDSVVFKRKI